MAPFMNFFFNIPSVNLHAPIFGFSFKVYGTSARPMLELVTFLLNPVCISFVVV
ncbi:hypothetical protein [Candidatus Harpocratesius sp.]